MPSGSLKKPNKKKHSLAALGTVFTSVIGLALLVFTFGAANSNQNVVSEAAVSRPVVGSWNFAGSNGGSRGWAYICIDRRFEDDRAVLFEPNPNCPAVRSIDFNFLDNNVGPLKLPAGNKYITVEAALLLHSFSGNNLQPVLGESEEYESGFGRLMRKFHKLLNRDYKRQTVSPTVPADVSNQGSTGTMTVTGASNKPNVSSQSVPQAQQKVPLIFTYLISEKKTPEQIQLWITPDGIMRNYEVRLPEVGEIEISKMQLLVKDLVSSKYQFGIKSVFLSADAVYNADNTLTITLTSPREQESLTGSVLLKAQTTGSDIQKVEFYAGSDYLLGTATRFPYELHYDTNKLVYGSTAPQRTPFYAKVYNDSGKVVTSSLVNVILHAVKPTTLPVPQGSVTTLSLAPPAGSPVPNGSGTVHVNFRGTSSHYSNSPDYKIFSFSWNGEVKSLKANKQYKVLLCMRNLAECGSSISQNWFTTDNSGNATFTMITGGYTVRRDNPISYVLILDADECTSFSAPCLRADYNLGSAGF